MLVNADRPAGHYSVLWDGKDHFGNDVSDGMYYYTLSIDDNIIASKGMIFMGSNSKWNSH
jgi:flagellar hook assembly protein FlgD